MESILTTIKKLLGIAEEYEHFDIDIITHINSVFMILNQIGVGPSECFRIEDETSTWNEFIPEDNPNFEGVKSYIHLRVKLLFDPPASSVVVEAYNRMINELETRLNYAAESKKS